MRHAQLLSAVYGQPWAIRPADWYAVHRIVFDHVTGKKTPPDNFTPKLSPRGERPTETFFGDKIQQMEIRNGVAIIPVKGTMFKGAGMFDKVCGACSHEDISADLDIALANGVRGIVLDISSPGGTVVGTPELAAKVAQINQSGTPILAFTDELIASAAYYIAAGAGAILTTGSATIGSIGTIWETYNVAESLAKEGVEFNIFTSGPYKGMGHPAKKLTDEQAAWMQNHVDELADEFKAHVLTFREVEDETMQGQIFTGKQAVENGLADGEVQSIADVLAMFD